MKRPTPDQLFHAARALEPAARRAYLEEAAAGDAALVEKVEALLASDADAGSFLDLDAEPGQAAPGPEAEGDWIGRFRLLQEIGAGGMGTVWMAEQHEPYRRKVALKVIKLGMDTREVVVRFEAERQALALMDHPHIARVIDGGATSSGRPYFVMELVRGVPITDYCDQAKLGLRERLELFSKVCEAVQHAHHKGIIHRDIKPSNVMVTLHDGVPVPKVIDFGIAKATSAELTQKTLFTQYAQIVGTPEYMAPEQAEMSGLDIDTRADVYSLGVLLYELLTGTKPFDIRKALEVGYNELLRTIREVDPVRPSTRISTLGERASVVAASRHANVASLSKRLRGDLDWIVMKSLEKDRTRRYETANGFAADIGRYLADEAVVAVPPSAGYQVRKFVSRNRGRVVAASILLVAVLVGLAGTTAGMLWAVEEKQAAELAREDALHAKADAEDARGEALAAKGEAEGERERAEEARELAVLAEEQTQRELARANESKRLIADMLAGVSPAVALGADTALLEGILEETGGRLLGGEVTDELIAAEVHSMLAGAYEALAKWDLVELHFSKAYELRAPRLEPGDRELLGDTMSMAGVHYRAGRMEQSIEFSQRAIAGYRTNREDDPMVGAVLGVALANMARTLADEERYIEAEAAMKEAIELQVELMGENNPISAGMKRNLAALYLDLGRVEEAEALHNEALAMDELFYDFNHPMVFTGAYQTASFYFDQERLAEAEALLVKALAGQERILPEGHPELEETRSLLSLIYARTGRQELVSEVLGEDFDDGDVIDPDSSLEDLGRLANFAVAKAQSGELEEAGRQLEAILEVTTSKFGGPPGLVRMLRWNLVSVLEMTDRRGEANDLMKVLYEADKEEHGPNHEVTRDTLRNLGLGLFHAGEFEEAEATYLDVLERDSTVGEYETTGCLGSQTNLALLYCETGRHAQAIEVAERSLAAKRRVLGLEHPFTLSAMHVLEGCYESVGRTADREAILAEIAHVKTLARVAQAESAKELLEIARDLVSTDDVLRRDPELAMEIVEDVWSSREYHAQMKAYVLEVRALVQFESGKTDEAIASVELGLKDLPPVVNEELRKRLEDGLERYRAAAEE